MVRSLADRTFQLRSEQPAVAGDQGRGPDGGPHEDGRLRRRGPGEDLLGGPGRVPSGVLRVAPEEDCD